MTSKKVPLTRKSKYSNGLFVPKNPEKYIGNPTNIIYRSSWEKRVMEWFDASPSVIQWNSEDVVIPYISQVDNKLHKYHIDFLATMQKRDGTQSTYLIEVKPNKERNPPRKSNNKERYIKELTTYLTNQSKWEAATKFCLEKGINFIVLDEYDLGIKKRTK